MTEQEIFDKAVSVIAARGYTTAGVYNDTGAFRCQYRSPVGPCAIGSLLDDNEVKSEWDENTISVSRIFFELPERIRGVGFLDSLQAAHDEGNTPAQIRQNFIDFAARYGLDNHLVTEVVAT